MAEWESITGSYFSLNQILRFILFTVAAFQVCQTGSPPPPAYWGILLAIEPEINYIAGPGGGVMGGWHNNIIKSPPTSRVTPPSMDWLGFGAKPSHGWVGRSLNTLLAALNTQMANAVLSQQRAQQIQSKSRLLQGGIPPALRHCLGFLNCKANALPLGYSKFDIYLGLKRYQDSLSHCRYPISTAKLWSLCYCQLLFPVMFTVLIFELQIEMSQVGPLALQVVEFHYCLFHSLPPMQNQP